MLVLVTNGCGFFINVLSWNELFVVLEILLRCNVFFELNELCFMLLKLGFIGKCGGVWLKMISFCVFKVCLLLL